MRQTTLMLGFLACGTALSGTAFAVDSQLLSLVMPDAKVLGGMNATSAESSPLGQFIVSKIGLGGLHQQQFIAATGFNPLSDVIEVLAASAADPANPGGLLLVRGNFDSGKITALVSGRPNVQVQTYAGNPLITTTNSQQKVASAVAFIGGTIAVAGDLPSVEAALDRINNPTSIDSALAARVAQLSAGEDEWLASSASLASLIPPNAAANSTPGGSNSGTSGPVAGLRSQTLPLLKNIQAFYGGVKFGDTVQFTGETVSTDADNAASLAAVIKLGMVLISSNASANQPRAADLARMLQGLQVTTNGSTVNVSLSVPEAQVEALLNTPPAPHPGN